MTIEIQGEDPGPIYALTREWNDYYAIREDVFLRISDIIEESGSGFAFPSQTLYLGRDYGVDEGRGKLAMEEVQSWRRSNQLPFPNVPSAELERVKDTLDYPPTGSPDADASIAKTTEEYFAVVCQPSSP